MLRKKGAYDEPRVHFALNCASVGCPMLREEAYVAARLEAQLEEQDPAFPVGPQPQPLRDGRLEVSKIFDWYRRISTRARNSSRAISPMAPAPITFLDYDWTLNDFPSSSRR
jgi:hypothetical protein